MSTAALPVADQSGRAGHVTGVGVIQQRAKARGRVLTCPIVVLSSLEGVSIVERWDVRAGARAYFGPRRGVGSRVGDVMFDGVIPLGEALRPLDLSGPSTEGGGGSTRRELAAAHLR